MIKSLNSNNWLKWLIPLTFFCLGLLNVGRDLFGFGQEEWHYAGDLVDTRFNNIILENNYQWIIGNHEAGLWNPSFFYPAKNMLAGSDAHLSTTPLYSLFRLTGFNMFSSFQLWVFCLFTLNFICCYYALRKFGLERLPSSLGAFIFSFSMPIMGQTFHIQSLCKFPIPLLFYFLYKWTVSFHYKDFLLLCFSGILMFYSSLYFTLLSVFPVVIVFIGLIIWRKKQTLKSIQLPLVKNIVWHSVFCIGTIILILPVGLKYVAASNHIPPIPREVIMARLPVPLSYLTCLPGSYFWGETSIKLQEGLVDPWNTYFGLGFITWIVLIVGLSYFVRNQKLLMVYTISLVGMFILFTKYTNFSFYLSISKLSGFNHLQAPWRFYMVAIFLVSLCLAWIIHLSWKRFEKYRVIIVFFVFLMAAENFVRHDSMKHTTKGLAIAEHKSIVDLVNKNKIDHHKAFVLLPQAGKSLSFENIISAMITAYECDLPCLNGYTTMGPEGYCIDWINPNLEQVRNWMHYNRWTEKEINENLLVIIQP